MSFDDKIGKQPVCASQDEAASALRSALRVAVPVEDCQAVAQRRQHLLTVLGQEIERVPKELARKETAARLRASLRWVVAAAVLLVCVWSSASLLNSIEEAKEESASLNVNEASPHQGQLYETASSETRELKLAGDTSLRLSSETRLRIFEDSVPEQSFQLSRGSIRVSVPKLTVSRSVRVVTPHATVSVKGTLFYVDVAPLEPGDRAPRTRVRVERGRVVVEHPSGEETLVRGQSWTSPSASHTPGHAEQRAASSASALEADRRSKDTELASQHGAGASTHKKTQNFPGSALRSDGVAAGARSESPNDPTVTRSLKAESSTSAEGAQPDSSTLSQQNALLEAALLAEKRGSHERAQELIDRLLREYPRSPLRASAQALKKRLE